MNKLVTKIIEHLEKAEALKNELLDKCPVKVGDIIPIEGWSYRGKKMKVFNIKVKTRILHNDRFTVEWVFWGDVLKKDGSIGVTQTYFQKKITE